MNIVLYTCEWQPSGDYSYENPLKSILWQRLIIDGQDISVLKLEMQWQCHTFSDVAWQHCIQVFSADTRRHLRSANRHLLATFPAQHFRPSGVFSSWPDGLELSRILPGIQRAAQTVLGVYLKRTCSRVTSASSALSVLNDYALYKSTHSITKIANRRLPHRLVTLKALESKTVSLSVLLFRTTL